MRVTSVFKRSLKNKFAYWLYEKWCNEPFIPNGKISVLYTKKGVANSSENRVKIGFKPDRFVPGIHEWYLGGVKDMEDLLK